MEALPLRQAADHELAERLLGVEQDEPAALERVLRRDAVALEVTEEGRAVRLRSDDQHAFAAPQASAGIFGDRLAQKDLVLVDLDEVIAARGLLEQLRPVGDAIDVGQVHRVRDAAIRSQPPGRLTYAASCLDRTAPGSQCSTE